MIPIKDTIPSKQFPIVNWIIILLNLGVFIFELTLNSSQLTAFFYHYGLVPSRVVSEIVQNKAGLDINIFTPFFTNMFIHGGFLHILGNMWVLYIFGDNVEDRMGSIRYLFFYLISGILASLTHFVLNAGSTVPAIGASGAIAGVMAAYMFLFPNSKVITLIPLFFILPLFIPIPAFIFIGLWFILQLFSGAVHLVAHDAATGIAFWAHVGGFLAGMFLYRYFLRKKVKRQMRY